MKRAVRNIVQVLILVAVLVIMFDLTIGQLSRKERAFGKNVRFQMGKNIEEAKLILGERYQVMDTKQYKERQPGMAGAFEPDPQLIECDLVYEYHEVATMGLLYVRNGIVIDTYVGGT